MKKVVFILCICLLVCIYFVHNIYFSFSSLQQCERRYIQFLLSSLLSLSHVLIFLFFFVLFSVFVFLVCLLMLLGYGTHNHQHIPLFFFVHAQHLLLRINSPPDRIRDEILSSFFLHRNNSMEELRIINNFVVQEIYLCRACEKNT